MKIRVPDKKIEEEEKIQRTELVLWIFASCVTLHCNDIFFFN